ncbi:Spy/CpxP family protein refolding chaperone [Castellaniella sp. S9]|uniref:Spy/CpxP family protein refolding chaperone n=1 Tax=Castellaniella sp. S9 TaxID=2993652 RepID=UPI0022B2C85E|nr:periplasmic heavy metal sensor [Castellaniella sp. S9]
MNARVLKSVLAASLALNVGFVGAVGYRQWLGSGMARTQPASALADRLSLSPSQRAAWHALEQPFLDDLATNWTDIRAQRQALLDEIFSGHPDTARLASIQARIASLQDAQQKRVIAQLLAEQAVLDEGQRALLKTLLLDEYGRQASTREGHLHQVPPQP